MSVVPPKLSHTEEYIIAKNKVKTEHTLIKTTVTPTSAKDGFLGDYFHLDMTIKERNGGSKTHRFFLKTLPMNTWQTDYLTRNGIFQREVSFYKDHSDHFRNYLSTDAFPECFLAAEEKIVLADVTLQGYRSKNLLEPLDYEHTKSGLEALARLHAASIIHEEKTGRKLGTDFPDLREEVNFKVGKAGADFLATGGKCMAALIPFLDTNSKRDPEAVAQMRDQVGPWIEKLSVYCTEDSPHRAVVCHGDSWPANFLYRYDVQQKPLSAMLVDFQMTRLRSPAFDVNTFLYLSVFTEDLKKWRESLLDAYYQVIVEEMKNCGLDAKAIYPKVEFLQAYIHYQKVGVIYALTFIPAFSRVSPELMAEVKSTSEKLSKFFFEDRNAICIDWYKKSPLLRRSVDGVVDEFYENFVKTNRGYTQYTQ